MAYLDIRVSHVVFFVCGVGMMIAPLFTGRTTDILIVSRVFLVFGVILYLFNR